MENELWLVKTHICHKEAVYAFHLAYKWLERCSRIPRGGGILRVCEAEENREESSSKKKNPIRAMNFHQQRQIISHLVCVPY